MTCTEDKPASLQNHLPLDEKAVYDGEWWLATKALILHSQDSITSIASVSSPAPTKVVTLVIGKPM